MRCSLLFAWKLALSAFNTFFCSNDLGTCSITQPAGVGVGHKQGPGQTVQSSWARTTWGSNSTGGGVEEDGGGWEEELKVALLRHTDSHEVHEKVLSMTNHQGNAYRNHKEILPHT